MSGSRFVGRGLWAFLLSLVILTAFSGATSGQTPAPAADPAGPPPDKVRQIMELMQAPEVQKWMSAQTNAAPSAPAAAAPEEQMSVLSDLLEHVRRHVEMVSQAPMALPDEVASASGIVDREVEPVGVGRILVQTVALFLAGPLAELLFRAVAPRPRIRRVDAEEPAGLYHAGVNLFYRLVPAIVFMIATLVALLVLNWPPVSQSMAIAVTIALVAARFVISLGRLLVALVTLPRADGEREVSRAEALFWFRRSAVFVIYFAFGWAVIQVLAPLGFSSASRYFVAYVLGIGLFLIATEAVWSRPAGGARRSPATSWALTLYFVLLWVLWVTGFAGLLWLGIYALILPKVLAIATISVRALHQAEAGFLAKRSMAAVLLDRGVRAVIIALAAVWLGRMIGVGADTMAAGETMVDRIARGVIGGVVILLAADLFWHLVKAFINSKLADAPLADGATDEEKARRARLQTLLPIFRNILAVVIAVIAVLMVLAGLSIQIAPLIAGAGVVGVAVGFGAQAIVKDVISGMFYLWDDAFRVGEYIESGSHKGVVEAFSLRSVKLRHHRGPLTTVPFGELGAVKNLNRDWTIDKISLNVTYDTDLVKAKKVIKQIGQQLLENPEFGPHIIETLKMKGVEQFGEFAIELRLSMMTKPGEQFVIRRNALAMIRNAFKENGIEFAVPTVQVAGDGREAEARAAAARHVTQKPDTASEAVS
ncbi:mechanosensitive ion channel family protein [Rhizobium mongolense]|uniref:Small-conductance mechanosensitive channel n=2 Tax=Rhizobium mongolense TaxID=57676 RepID=A0ABR6ITD9_9HYPH|nr:mechanosensitive ion channel family protein [Rhizobium mongolense]MBB4231171.1 small-conductance mechanosensitive channel [Rhizobium mongolense]TVZ66531.1 small-conductance mechanosensitive channel [Rhizobium mongolense USDA 1844]